MRTKLQEDFASAVSKVKPRGVVQGATLPPPIESKNLALLSAYLLVPYRSIWEDLLRKVGLGWTLRSMQHYVNEVDSSLPENVTLAVSLSTTAYDDLRKKEYVTFGIVVIGRLDRVKEFRTSLHREGLRTSGAFEFEEFDPAKDTDFIERSAAPARFDPSVLSGITGVEEGR